MKNICLLQPEDSERVAKEIICTIREEFGDGFGDAIIRSISKTIEGCLGSHEMAEVVRRAIENGIINTEINTGKSPK